MSRCAACLEPFLAVERKVVSDTEVFHDRCVPLVPRSLTNKLKQRVIDLSARVRTLEADAAETARLRINIDAANAEARRVRADNDRLCSELREARAAARDNKTAADTYIQLSERLRLDQAENKRRIEALEREVALHQTIQGQRVEAPTVTQKPDPQDDKKDDTEKRFSLLELD